MQKIISSFMLAAILLVINPSLTLANNEAYKMAKTIVNRKITAKVVFAGNLKSCLEIGKEWKNNSQDMSWIQNNTSRLRHFNLALAECSWKIQ